MRTEPLRVHRQGGKAVGCGNVLPAARPAINNEFPPREAELAQGRRGAALSTGSSEHFGCRPRLVRPLPAKTLEELVLRPCSPPRPGEEERAGSPAPCPSVRAAASLLGLLGSGVNISISTGGFPRQSRGHEGCGGSWGRLLLARCSSGGLQKAAMLSFCSHLGAGSDSRGEPALPAPGVFEALGDRGALI